MVFGAVLDSGETFASVNGKALGLSGEGAGAGLFLLFFWLKKLAALLFLFLMLSKSALAGEAFILAFFSTEFLLFGDNISSIPDSCFRTADKTDEPWRCTRCGGVFLGEGEIRLETFFGDGDSRELRG